MTGAVGRWADIEALDGIIDPGRADRAAERGGLARRDHLALVPRAGRGAAARRCGRARRATRSPSSSDAINQIGPEAWREEHEHDRAALDRRRGARDASRTATRSSRELVHAPDIIAVVARHRPLAARGGARVLPARRAARHRLARGRSSSSCRPARAGSGGRSSRWRTICSRCAASCANEAWSRAGERRSTRRSRRSSRPARTPSRASTVHAEPGDGGRDRPLAAHRRAAAAPRPRRLSRSDLRIPGVRSSGATPPVRPRRARRVRRLRRSALARRPCRVRP